MIHPNTELQFISPEIGYGVVATRLIPRGTITWIFDEFDQVFTARAVAQMDAIHQQIINTYSYRDHLGQYILCWDHSRFINHSFNSNCISTAYNFELAVRDIHSEEQLTDDYGYLNVQEPFYCLPELSSKRQVVLPDDLLNYHQEWDRKLIQAFEAFNSVDQPLLALIDPIELVKVAAVANGTAVMDSILNCYYPGD